MKRITITLDEEMYRSLQRIMAKKLLQGENTSFTQVVREALEYYIKGSTAVSEER